MSPGSPEPHARPGALEVGEPAPAGEAAPLDAAEGAPRDEREADAEIDAEVDAEIDAEVDAEREGEAEARLERVLAKLGELPTRPGCYLFHDRAGKVVYVGKAKSLRARVRSYFQEGGSDARFFIPLLRRIVGDLETVVTGTEKEAAVLENELIKKHKPRFNVKLRDDKDFLCLRIDQRQRWPRVEPVRRPSPDGARYFGPFHSATSARRTLHLVNKHWQLRTCSDAELASRRRPCLQYQIKRCPAPCVYDVDPAQYQQQVESVSLFLEGRHDELTSDLEGRMRDAARRMEFELAAIYRDQLRAVSSARETQRVVAIKDVDQDVLGMHREGSLVELVLMQVRKGRMVDSLSFSLRGIELPDDELLSGFVGEYYGGDGSAFVPDEVVLPALPEGAAGIAEWLSEVRAEAGGRRAKVSVLAPQRGPRLELLRMASDNAAHAFKEKQRAADDLEARLEELRERLRLEALPRRIECCDISHLGGGDVVGSVVALRDGLPDKRRYRSFHVRGAVLRAAEPTAGGAALAREAASSLADEVEVDAARGAEPDAPRFSAGDDYAAMYEVLSRRFRRGKAAAESVDEQGAGWELPDLFVVDGGRGQLNVALAAARDLGLHGLAIVGLAKERETVAGDKLTDRVYLPGQKNGIPLRSTSSALFFLARARDEAHRFANEARKKLGKERRLRSELDDVKGLGKAGKLLLRSLGSLEAVRAASDERLLSVEGMTKRHLAALRRVLPAPSEPSESSESSESSGPQ